MINFLDELGNFKQKKFYSSKCKFFLHFKATDPITLFVEHCNTVVKPHYSCNKLKWGHFPWFKLVYCYDFFRSTTDTTLFIVLVYWKSWKNWGHFLWGASSWCLNVSLTIGGWQITPLHPFLSSQHNHNIPLLPFSEYMLDEKFQWNTLIFAIFYF